MPLGPFLKNGDFMEGDLYRESSPKISLGLGGSFNHKATKTNGQRGSKLFEERDITNLIADVLLKYNGWALSAEYIEKRAGNPVFEEAPDEFPGHMMTGYGLNTQLSYLTTGLWEIAIRYAIIEPDSEVTSLEAARDEVLLGLTRYIKGHRIKAQTHIGINNFRNVPAGADREFRDQWVWMFQLEFGI